MKKENIINILSNAKKVICSENIDNCKYCELRSGVILEDAYSDNEIMSSICETLNKILDELEKVE